MARAELMHNPAQEGPSHAEIDIGLTELVKLFDDWRMEPNDHLLIDEFALWLQGIKRVGPEIRGRNFDVWVDYEKLPWRPLELDIFGKRIMAKHVYPPLREEVGKQYIDFIQRAKFGAKIRLGTNQDVQLPAVSYPLPDGRSVRLITPDAQITEFYKNTLARQTEMDVGFAKLQEWEEKLLGYHAAAEALGNESLAARISVMHMEALARHPKLWYSRLEGTFLPGFWTAFGIQPSIYDKPRSISR